MDKKDKTNDLLDLDDGDGRLKVAGDLPREKDQEQWDKKIKSVSNEDGDVVLHEKGNMGGDGNIGKKDKKRKKESTEDNHLYYEKAQIEGKELGPVDEPDCHPGLRKEKKRKQGVHGKEHGNNNAPTSHEISKGENMVSDEVVHGKEQGSADVPDCDPKSRKKKRKHKVHEKKLGNDNGSMSHEISKAENVVSDEVVHRKEQGPADEPDCGPNSREEKKRKHEVHEKNLGINNVSTAHEICKGENVVSDDEVVRGKEQGPADEPDCENVVSDVVVHGKEQGSVDEPDCDPKSRKEKRKHEIHEKEHGNNNVSTSHEISKGENVVSEEVVHSKSSLDEDTSKMINDIVDEDTSEMINGIVDADTQRGAKESDAQEMKKTGDAKATETSREYSARESFEKVGKKKTTEMKKTDKDHNSDSEVCGVMAEESGKGCSTSQGQKSVAGESDNKSIIKTRDSEGKKKKSIKACDNNPKVEGKFKKVSFSGEVEVFPSSDRDHEKRKTQEDKLVRGKRFTPEEDELVKEAVLNYIKRHNLGEEGLTKVLNCHSYPGLKNCWKEIGTCIPYRPVTTIYYRAHNLFERADKRQWTEEETDFLQKSYEKHGNNWKMVAEELGKHRIHVKDKWRRIKLSNRKAGKWSQEEYQSLHDLVNLDLQMKVVSKERKTKHGMLRDNIRWGAISDKLSTRSDFTCCQKWYNQLTSSLVAEDKWSNADDYRLISALYDLDAACVEDVDWDALLDHRPGDVCRKRWDQMVLHIGHHGSQPFSEQVETLSKRYCPDLAEIREAWDRKPLAQ